MQLEGHLRVLELRRSFATKLRIGNFKVQNALKACHFYVAVRIAVLSTMFFLDYGQALVKFGG